ncbi:MAG: DUF2975 domain-containing protein [Parachlamydiales bacterium]|jgi:hypothetical protein
MHKIQKVSRIFRYLLLVLCFLLPLLEVSFWATGHGLGLFFPGGQVPSFLPHPQTVWQYGNISVDFFKMPLSVRLLGFFVSSLVLAVKLLFVYFLIGLFRLYEKLIVFSEKNTCYFKKMGFLLLFSQLLSPFYEALFSLAITSANAKGQRMISISIDEMNFFYAGLGFLIILFSWIMSEGQKLQEEQKLII